MNLAGCQVPALRHLMCYRDGIVRPNGNVAEGAVSIEAEMTSDVRRKYLRKMQTRWWQGARAVSGHGGVGLCPVRVFRWRRPSAPVVCRLHSRKHGLGLPHHTSFQPARKAPRLALSLVIVGFFFGRVMSSHLQSKREWWLCATIYVLCVWFSLHDTWTRVQTCT